MNWVFGAITFFVMVCLFAAFPGLFLLILAGIAFLGIRAIQ